MQEIDFVSKVRQAGGRVFVVGGWVRDHLRKGKAKDKDYVICGLAEETFQRIFSAARKVGKSFPVYLLEIDGKSSEIAFARRERKTSPGYRGFAVEYDPGVTLEEDLWRRDTTMNSLAIELPDGTLWDFFHGQRDIEQKKIRAVSAHFLEDPVRALRAARQAAAFGFEITEETLIYMRACRTELLQEPQERIVQELSRALEAPQPSWFFISLERAGLLAAIFPEIHALLGKTQPVEFHPEGDAFAHTMHLLDQVAAQTTKPEVRFAALVHDLGKGTTPQTMLPHHYGHEMRGIDVLAVWNKRCTLPKRWLQCGTFVIREHMRSPRLSKSGKIVALLLQVYKSPLNFLDFNAIILADHGSLPDYLIRAEQYIKAILKVSGKDCPANYQGAQIGVWLDNARVRAYQSAIAEKTKL